MEKLLASYRESRLELRRRFDLFPDTIHVYGGGLFYPRVDHRIRLALIYPGHGRTWVRGKFFAYGMWALITVAITCAVNLAIGGIAFLTQPWFLIVFGVMASFGLVLVAATIRPVEFATFHTDAGVAVLDVGRSGPQAAEFDEFIAYLIERIAASKAGASPPPSGPGEPGAIRLPSGS